jgi:Heterokaryon incompatibility protein (HET)
VVLKKVVGQIYLTVLWIYLAISAITVLIVTTLDWGLYLWKFRAVYLHLSKPQGSFRPSDLKKLEREQRFNVVAEWNTRFYQTPLAKFLTSKKYIRLVEIHPGAFEEPLVCTTRIESLVDDLEYVALSYAWGDLDEKSILLTLDGQDGFRISWNASNALRRIRAREERRLVWIDQISIDQFNYKEKEQQIGLMGAIYQRAKLVYIFLGPCLGSHSSNTGVASAEITECHEHTLLSLQDGVRPWFCTPTSPTLRWWERAWTVGVETSPI